ncbi:hypothetical protein B0J13DRAFT_449599 [Dactylonectria estremocensis]|uniref:Uncharacterized protein n=1 Tax=Dactylonectria estremocensis TaxID=1079267 RepID=A0A9P9EGR2_9HYPO|nr:hypothetical protein B0J13DRAFT_449599 [Dactylonectria estremocensis]
MAKQWDPLTDIPDLHGKVAVVTGASSGVGYEIVKRLAQRGAKVYLTTRTEAKAQMAKETLITECSDVSPANIAWLLIDFIDLKSVDAAALELSQQESKVDILVNNAAVSSPSTELAYGRWEQHMAGNYVGPFLFANRILPLLKSALQQKNADVRIINLSSTAQIAFLPPNFEFRFDSADGLREPVTSYPWVWRYFARFIFSWDMIRYAVSKTAVTAFTKELQRRFLGQHLPIICIAVHPGEVLTKGLLDVNNVIVRTLARVAFSTAEQGAVSPLFAATAKDVRENAAKYEGKFLMPVGKPAAPHPIVENEQQVKGIWDVTTAELNKQLSAENLPLLRSWE